MNFDEISALGAILDDTFTGATTGSPSNGSFKIISKLVSDSKMTITCMVIVNLLNRSQMRKEAESAKDQLSKACNEKLKIVKKEFKDRTGRALKTKESGVDHSVELINMSAYSPKGTALVRNVFRFEVS